MNRRDSLKTLLIGSVGATTIATGIGCKTESTTEVIEKAPPLYGRTAKELERDEEIRSDVYLNEHELTTIAVLCDIILPATEEAGSANDAKVPGFIEFIVKDLPVHQLPMRGGLMWLDSESNRRFAKRFVEITDAEQIQIIEDIAYPDPDEEKPAMAYGIRFFNLIRNLVVTGYYTTKIGFDDLGYIGNFANVWDGVPAEILAEHDVDYDEEWLSKCVDQSQRMVIAEWDEKGNLLT